MMGGNIFIIIDFPKVKVYGEVHEGRQKRKFKIAFSSETKKLTLAFFADLC